MGQIWLYRTRAIDGESRLYIFDVTHNEKIGEIFSVYIDGLKIENPYIDGGIQDFLPHAPVLAETLNASVTTLVATRDNDFPEISVHSKIEMKEAYDTWRKEYDKGDAGAFTISVAEIIQYIEDIANGKLNG